MVDNTDTVGSSNPDALNENLKKGLIAGGATLGGIALGGVVIGVILATKRRR